MRLATWSRRTSTQATSLNRGFRFLSIRSPYSNRYDLGGVRLAGDGFSRRHEMAPAGRGAVHLEKIFFISWRFINYVTSSPWRKSAAFLAPRLASMSLSLH